MGGNVSEWHIPKQPFGAGGDPLQLQIGLWLAVLSPELRAGGGSLRQCNRVKPMRPNPRTAHAIVVGCVLLSGQSSPNGVKLRLVLEIHGDAPIGFGDDVVTAVIILAT